MNGPEHTSRDDFSAAGPGSPEIPLSPPDTSMPADIPSASPASAIPPTAPHAAPPGRYTLLLNQVQQVNAELQEARVLIASFKKENEELIQNFDTCKDQLIETRVKYQRCQSELLEATERQVHTDAKAEAFREEVLSQIADREEALRHLQQTLVPQDLDLLRVQLTEELEQPHREKLAAAEAEAAKWEALYYNVRRVHEKERSEHELFKEQVKAAIDSDRAVFEAEVAGLHAKVEALESAASALSLDEALLQVSGELSAAQLREQELKVEATDVRRSLEAMEAARHSDATAAVEALATCEASLAASNANLHAQARAKAEAEASVAALSSQVSALREAVAEKTSEQERQRAELTSRERELQEAERRNSREAERQRSVLESEKRRLEEKSAAAVARAEREEAAAKLERKSCQERVDAALAGEELGRREGRRAVEALRSELLKVQASEAAARLELKEQARAAEEARRGAAAEASDVGAAKAAAVKEGELLRAKIAKLGDEIAAERREREQLAKKCDQANDAARSAAEKLGLAEGKAAEHSAAEQAQAQAVAHVQKEYAALVAQLDLQRQSHSKDLAALNEQHESERRASLTSARRQHDALRAAAAQALDKERKRTAKYKQAAQQAHEATKRVKEQHRRKAAGAIAPTRGHQHGGGGGGVGKCDEHKHERSSATAPTSENEASS